MSATKPYHQSLKRNSVDSNNSVNSSSCTETKKNKMETSVAAQKRNRRGFSSRNGETVNSSGESEHEVHILTERERRKKMRTMFTNLHALLPQLPAKADKTTIVDEAIKYVKTLEETLQTLEKRRQEKLKGATNYTDHSSEPSVITIQTETIESQSREAFLASHQGPAKSFSMNTNMPYMFPVSLSNPTCFQTWFSANVVMNMCGDDAQISVCSLKRPDLLTSIFYILEKHKLDVVSSHISSDQFRSIYMIHVHAGAAYGQYPEALSVEDTFKLAAGEMNLWVLSS
ncbi:transcription factor bHLH95-like [Mercurialis annua]|uniref:transcription factor bHLH95-like n=1 Tax=Mercurialis annua TaxID=3986 RepID=UPI0024AF84B0|nr:transcription factor bHLH95-like [Mercurialis annua]